MSIENASIIRLARINPAYARQAQRTIHLFDGRVLEESAGG